MEILARSLFALDRRWPPVIAAVIPVLVNVVVSLRLGANRPEYIGLGSSLGLAAGFVALFAMAHLRRKQWLMQG
jgi:peptidoglycan biosynthesis protein MviN/MurJ (putative lipid II flippase)